MRSGVMRSGVEGRRAMAWPRRGALLVALVLVAAGCDWAQFGFGAGHTRANPQESALSTSTVATLATAWTGATTNLIDSSPSIAKGVAYVGSNDGRLYAFDATGTTGCSGTPKTCAPLWTATTGSGIFSSPAVVNNIVYVGSADGKLYAFDAAGTTNCSGTPKTCAPLWTATTGGPVLSSPAVVGGFIYVGSFDGKVYAFSAAATTGCSGTPKTCVPVWTAPTGTGSVIVSSPAVANNVVYVGSSDHKLYSFDATGTTGCSGTPKTCAPLWTVTTGDVIYSSPAVVDGVVYVGSFDGKLYAIDATGPATLCTGTPKSCTPLWTVTTNDSIVSSPAVAGGVVYIGSQDHSLYAIDATGPAGLCAGTPRQCAPLWIGTTDDSISSSPGVANGVVYVGSTDAKLYAFDAAGAIGCAGAPKVCDPLRTVTTGGAIAFSSPAITNGVVYVGSYNGRLSALKP